MNENESKMMHGKVRKNERMKGGHWMNERRLNGEEGVRMDGGWINGERSE